MERKKKSSPGSKAGTSGGTCSGGSTGEGSSQSFGPLSDNSTDLNLSRGQADDASDGPSTSAKKSEMPLYHIFSEDLRISKILRRLRSETNGQAAIDLCIKLEQVIQDPANAAYIRRAFDCLAESLMTVMNEGPEECLSHVTVVFGVLGYVVRHDFHIYKNWIFKNYDQMKNIRGHLIRALKVTLNYDVETLELINYSDTLIETLKNLLESADQAEDFIALSDVITQFSRNYKESFEKHFTDIVDIVVGWHLEIEQTMELKQHCSTVLQSFSEFFIKKDDFTFGLMSQFLEDITAFGEDIENPNAAGSRSPTLEKGLSPEVSVGSFIGAFNSVLKCLALDTDIRTYHITPTFLEESMETILRVAHLSLSVTLCQETVLATNEFMVLILSCYRHNVQCDYNRIFDIIQLEMKELRNFSDAQISSFLFVLLHYSMERRTNLPVEFITFLFQPNNAGFSELKLSSNKKHYKILLKLYHAILIIKNVPIIQEAYRHILVDIREALKCMREFNEHSYTAEQAECILNFYLSAISVIATQTSSIIGMYALQPSILDVLINDLDLANMNLWAENPVLHHSCIHLLTVHCMKNNNYVLSSNLLITNVFSKLSLDDMSPTAENFSMILKFLGQILQASQLSSKTVFRLLSWVQFIYHQCGQYSETLKSNASFTEIGKNLCKLSTKSTANIILECGECIDVLFAYEHVNGEILNAIGEACCIHMRSTDHYVRELYAKIFAKLPLNVALKEAQESTGVMKCKDLVINDLNRWYILSPISSNFRETHFVNFFNLISLKDCTTFIENYLLSIFPKCWVSQRGRGAEFFSLARNNLNYLLAWLEWEVAMFCVNNKLRTPLGKPQDTLVNVEALIREAIQVLSRKKCTNLQDVETLIANQKHLRVLLGFLECLEKAIFNAAEGSAFAIPMPEKPVRSFFKINTPTCREWLNRTRTAVDLLAQHSLEPEMIMRCSETMLNVMVTLDRIRDLAFEHTIMFYVWGLIRNHEADSLHGLYIWAKRMTGKRYTWIKYASEHAAGHKEKAAEGYITLLSDREDEILEEHVRDFVADMLMECLYFTEQWDQLKYFLQTRPSQCDPKLSVPIVSPKYDQVECIQIFEESGDAQVINLANWEVLDRETEVSNYCSFNHLLTISENTLMIAVLEDPDTLDGTQLMACTKVIQSGVEELLLNKTKDSLNHYILLNHIAHKIKETQNCSNPRNVCNLESINIDKTFGSATINRVFRWAEYLSSAYNLETNVTTDLCLKAASVARKEGNLRFCKHLLEKVFKKACPKLLQTDLGEIGRMLITNRLENITWNGETIRAVYEVSKWLYCQNDKQEEAIQLEATCCLGALTAGKATEDVSRSLLTLSDWVGQNPERILSLRDSQALRTLLSEIPAIQTYSDENIDAVIPELDKAVGKLIQCSTQKCPDLAKTWSALGSWSYRWGRKIFEQRTSGGLRPCDIEAIQSLIPDGSAEDINEIVAVLSQHEVLGDDEEIDPNEASSTEIIESQLRNIPILEIVDTGTIQSIVGIWRQAHKSVYAYYELAASSYFKFLNLASASDEAGKNGDCSTVTATLRLLRLIVKHALGLQEVLEEGLATTPTRPWKVITPQLFSRLNHHELYVRKRVSELLCRVAKDSPHLIIFPTVVGVAEKMFEDFDERKESNNALTSCFNSLLDTLSTQALDTVKQVLLLVRELKRITMLWDEYWLHSLAQLFNEYSELFRTFEAEARKSKSDNLTLVTEKHRILMSHVVDDLKRIAKVTNRPPETNYEKNFQEKYGKMISATIEDVGAPFDPDKPSESMHKLKQLFLIFQQRVQKASQSALKTFDISPALANLTNTAISMPGVEASDNEQVLINSMDTVVYILPTKTKPKKFAFFGSDGKRYTYLFKGSEDLHLDERIMQFLAIANTIISKPVEYNGFTPNYRAHHYSVIPLGARSGLISWVDGVMPIFGLYRKWQQREASSPKKDKPYVVMRPSEMFYNKLTPLIKDLKLKNANCRKYWPLSVLRQVLDELKEETPRDLLSKEFWCYSNNAASWRRVVRTYAVSVAVMSVIGYVIGLGDRHLDNILVKLSTGEIVHIDYNVCFEKGKTLRVPEKVPFRMTTNLEAALGVTGVEGTFRLACEHVLKTLRKERETLLTLLEAFVYDPLVDWAVSDDGTTSSPRVTSVLAAAADIMALTANANAAATEEAAGGAADGGSEAGRQEGAGPSQPGAETQDPSNMPGTSKDVTGPTKATSSDKKEGGKKFSGNEVMRDALVSRFVEIKPEWTQYRNDIQDQLREMIQFLDDLEMQREQMIKDEDERDLLTKQMATVHEVESLGAAMSSHPINTLSQRYSVYRKCLEELENAKELLIDTYRESIDDKRTYLTTISDDYEANLNDMKITLNNLLQIEMPSEFEFVKDLLKNSAQEAMYLQADQARKELDASLVQQSFFIKVGIDALLQYNNVVSYLPQREVEKQRWFQYERWSQNAIEDPESSDDVLRELDEALEEERTRANAANILKYAYELENMWIDATFSIRQQYETLHGQLTDSSGLLEDANNCAKQYVESDITSMKAMHCVYLTLLLDIRQQLHSTEQGSLRTITDPFLVLTEQLSHIHLITETSTILFINTPIFRYLSHFIEPLMRLRAALESLKDLEIYFKTEVIPHIIQTVMVNRTALAKGFQKLKELQADLQTMLEKLENDLNCEMDSLQILRITRSVQESLSQEEASFFIDFEKMFGRVLKSLEVCYVEMARLKYMMKAEHLPDPFLSSVTLAVFKKYTHHSLRQQFKVRKLQALVHTIRETERLCNCLLKSDLDTVFDHKLLYQPIGIFVFEFQSNFLFGMGPYLLSMFTNELFCRTSELNLHTITLEKAIPAIIEQYHDCNSFTGPQYVLAQGLCAKLCQAIKQKHQTERIKEAIRIHKIVSTQSQLLSSVHIWVNERFLPLPLPFAHIIPRNVLLTNFQNAIQNLGAWKISIQKICDEVLSFNKAIVQRLKWAVGANPSLIGLQRSFLECVEKQELKFNEHCEIASGVMIQCAAVIAYENVKRNAIELTENDENFTLLINELRLKHKAYKQAAAVITPIEEALVQLLDPEGPVDQCWINNVSGLLDEMTDAMQRKISSLEKDLVTTQDNLQLSAHKLRSLLDNELRMDVRYLLKSILKIDKNDHATNYKQFQINYKQFLSRINDLHMKVLSKDFTEEIVTEIRNIIAELIDELEYVYRQLLQLLDADGKAENERPIERREGKLPGSPMKEKKANQPEQKRNAYAVSVWRRIRMKLEGRDPDPNRRLTVAEQVDWMIREAMNPDNLAVLYEGWTPWV